MKNTTLFLAFLSLLNAHCIFAQNQSIGNPPDWNWVQTIGGNSGPDRGLSIVGDAQGNFYIAGDFSGSTLFGNSTLTTQGQVNGFVAYCDPSGEVLWTKQFKSSSPDGKVYATSVSLDPNGNLFVFGYFRGGDLILGAQTFFLASSTESFLAKFEPNGALIWLKTEGAISSSGLANGKILADSDGSVYVHTRDYIRKFSSSGNQLWEQFNGSSYFTDIALKGNRLIFSGTFSGNIQFDNETLNSPSHAMFMVNLDKTSGIFYNASILASISAGFQLHLNSISAINETDYYIAGNFAGDLAIIGSFSLSSPNSNQYFVAKFASGACAWALQSTGAGVPNINIKQATVLADDIGDVYFFGNRNGPISFGNSFLGVSESGFLAKFDGSTSNVKSLKTQPAHINGWVAGQNLFQIGAPYYSVIYRKANISSVTVERNLTSDSGIGYVTSTKTDSSGVYFLANVSAKTYFLGQNNYNSIPSTVVTKTNHAGNNLLWQQTIAGASSVYTFGHSLWLDKNHDKLYLVGTFPSVFTYGSQFVDTTGNKGVFVSQMGADGSFGWIKTLPKTTYLHSVITDAAGNVYINGTFSGELQLGATTLVSAGGDDIFWAKLNPNGQFLMAKRMGGEDSDIENYAGIDAQGNFYMSGFYFSKNIDFNGTNHTTYEDGDGLFYYVKFAPNGQVLWVKNFGNTDLPGTEYSCAATNVEVDASGNSYIIGYHGESSFFGNLHLTSPYTFNTFVTKINPSGDPIWVKSIRTKRLNYNFCEIGLDETGNCYIGGQYRDSIYFDGTLITKVGSQDAYFAKLNGNNGNTIWAKTISGGTEAVAWPATISVFDKESLLVGGHIIDRLNFDGQSFNTYNGRKGFLALIGQSIVVSTEQPTANAFFITVSPNPTAEKVTISNAEDFTGNLLLEIFDASGQLVAKQALTNFDGKTTLDLSASPAGTYFLKASSSSGQQIVRLVKN